MTQPPYDPRAVANLLLDLAVQEEDDAAYVSNLALQKLLYFAHALFLIRTGEPLVSGSFEAWKLGPVHPAVYHAFKGEGDRIISIRAMAINVMTGQHQPLMPPADPRVRRHIREVLRSYGTLSPGRLVDITHAPNGPWAATVNKAKTSIALGLRIPDDVTVERFKYMKISVGPMARVGEPNEDAPFGGD